jgi:hypothetical protein
MQDLRVIGVENGALLVAADDGTRYRIAIDEVLQSKLRQNVPEPGMGKKLAPREIQAHIRSGMSAHDVASITGVPIEYIQKFEGAILAEREFVVTSALAVPVHTAADTGPLSGSTFGTVIRARLYDLGAVDERWASWKEIGGGWIVKLAFTSEEIEHDARWRFDPKKSALSPLNSEAITLSQQGEATGALIPRLRAVDDDERTPDQTRFDSGAFTVRELADRDRIDHEPADRGSTSPFPDLAPYGRLADAPQGVSDAAINRAPVEAEVESNQTADLLEALRRRRGEREAANFADEAAIAAHPSTGSIRMVDVPMPDFTKGTGEDRPSPFSPEGARSDETPGHTAPQPTAFTARQARKGRASMPSWDDIVFGAKSDDE